MPVPLANESGANAGGGENPSSDGAASAGRKTPPLDANAAPWTPGWTPETLATYQEAHHQEAHHRYAGYDNVPQMYDYAGWVPHVDEESQARQEAQAQQEALARAASKRAVETREHQGWAAIQPQMAQHGARPNKMVERAAPQKSRPQPSGGAIEKQQALVKACLRARARPLTHTQPPTNLTEIHRSICEKAAKAQASKPSSEGEGSGELTPRFPPQSQVFDVQSELPRILGRGSANTLALSPKAEESLGIDLKFLDDESPTHHDDSPPQNFDAMSALFASAGPDIASARPNMPAMPPPQPRFLAARLG
jgi:hypothetical protein